MTEQLGDISHRTSDDPIRDVWFRQDRVTLTDGGRSSRGSEDREDTRDSRRRTTLRDATTERLAEVSHRHEDQPDVQGELWKRGRVESQDDE